MRNENSLLVTFPPENPRVGNVRREYSAFGTVTSQVQPVKRSCPRSLSNQGNVFEMFRSLLFEVSAPDHLERRGCGFEVVQ